jgi:WD40 repeat protein
MTSERVAFLPGDFGGVYRLAYSPDGRLLATVGSDNKLRLWNTQSGTVTATLEGHGPGLAGGLFPGIMDVAFSPDGTRILTASSDGTARLWDAAGQPLAFLEGHTGGAVGGLQPRQRPHPHQR